MTKDLWEYMYTAVDRNVVKNRKLIRNFVYSCEQNSVPVSWLHTHIDKFKEEDYYKSKAETTRENYLYDLKNFIRYVYSFEGLSMPESVRYHEDIVQGKKEEKQRKKKLDETTYTHTVPMAEPVVSEEYYEFLKRYEELNKE